jgi:cellulose synthase/poly-beta-1,6-N-acetylglucosamine synthase-like glycosyltransferase
VSSLSRTFTASLPDKGCSSPTTARTHCIFAELSHHRAQITMWMTFIFAGTVAMFLAMTFAAVWHLRWVRRLPSLATLTNSPRSSSSQNQSIRCSVVIAARDEEARIEQTIRHLLAQRGVEAEFIIVDDRSRDRTSEILRQLKKEDPRLHVKRVDVLPEGWLGKCHACHVGANEATGDWILFTDADCWLKPDVIARAVRLAEREGADHVTMSPSTVGQSLGAQAWHLLFLTSLVNWFSGVNRDRPKSYLGIGAFNLVRAESYRQCGGYEALRLTVLDDVKFGLLLRRAGKRTRGFLGVDDVECHWGTTVGSMVKVMEKNYFAALDFRLWLVLAGSGFTILVLGILLLGLLAGTAAGLAAALSPVALILPAAILARRVGWTWPCAVCMPFMLPVFLYALLNSTFLTLRHDGVRWRETFYSLDTLREGTVR